MSTPGATELLVVLLIVILILGPKRLPSLGRQLGGGFREFRKSVRGPDRTPRGHDVSAADARSPLPSSAPETVDGEVIPERRNP